MEEIWAKAVGFEAFIEVSNLGGVRGLDTVRHSFREGLPNVQRRKGKVFKPQIGNNGYPYISLQIDGKRKKYLVHRHFLTKDWR